MRHPASLPMAYVVLASVLALMPPVAQAQFRLTPSRAPAQFDPARRIAPCAFKHGIQGIAALSDVPAAIRDAIGPMADKNAFFNATDVYMRGIPNRGFVSAGQSGDRYFVWYQQGGIALFSLIAVYRLPSGAAKAELVTQQRDTGGDLCQTIDTVLDAKPTG